MGAVWGSYGGRVVVNRVVGPHTAPIHNTDCLPKGRMVPHIYNMTVSVCLLDLSQPLARTSYRVANTRTDWACRSKLERAAGAPHRTSMLAAGAAASKRRHVASKVCDRCPSLRAAPRSTQTPSCDLDATVADEKRQSQVEHSEQAKRQTRRAVKASRCCAKRVEPTRRADKVSRRAARRAAAPAGEASNEARRAG